LNFIVTDKRTQALGIRPLKGVLLAGPPGTGKTLLAKAAANYTEAAFLAVTGSEFIEMYAGIGAQRIRNLFQQARRLATESQKQTAVVFIDEIDVLGSKRGQHQGHLEYDQTLNQLLAEMDGIKQQTEPKILVIAATNRLDVLDPALLRPGRFDRVVQVDLPDQESRYQILKLHTSNKPLADNVNLKEIARATFGFSGAHLENLSNEAAILALRKNRSSITQEHLIESIDKVSLGEKLERRPQRDELWRIAIHEVGHALVSECLKPGSVAVLTIVSRGQALGYTRQIPDDDHYLHTETYLRQQIQILLAGFTAEEILLGSTSTGAQGDLEQAVSIAKRMVKAGMTPLGLAYISGTANTDLYKTTNKILDREKRVAEDILQTHQTKVVAIAKLLLAKERLEGKELRSVLAQPTPSSNPIAGTELAI
jgi:ATP-dependent metalloprotease FtsH